MSVELDSNWFSKDRGFNKKKSMFLVWKSIDKFKCSWWMYKGIEKTK